jgi:hypothetical protein
MEGTHDADGSSVRRLVWVIIATNSHGRAAARVLMQLPDGRDRLIFPQSRQAIDVQRQVDSPPIQLLRAIGLDP